MSRKKSVIRLLLQRVISFSPVLAQICGDDVETGVFLAQAIYWSETKDDGWFYKTAEEWQEETRLKRRAQDNARECLKNLGFLEERNTGRMPCTKHYRVCFEKVENAISLFVQNVQTAEASVCTERTNMFVRNEQTCLPETSKPYKEAKITTENTHPQAVGAPPAVDKNQITSQMAGRAFCETLGFSGSHMNQNAHSAVDSYIRHNPGKNPESALTDLLSLWREYDAAPIRPKSGALSWLTQGMYHHPEKWRKHVASNGNGHAKKQADTPSVAPYLEEMRKKRERAQAEQDGHK